MRDNQTLKIELLISPWKLEAEFRNISAKHAMSVANKCKGEMDVSQSVLQMGGSVHGL